MSKIPSEITIPDNIRDYLDDHYGVALDISIDSTDALNGYGEIHHEVVKICELTRTCRNCGYDPLWHPDDSKSKCKRHSYGSERYDVVFVWSPYHCNLSLEDAFDIWLEAQYHEEYAPVVKCEFGEIKP